MNWKLDTISLCVWNLEGTPFGVEKIDRGAYVPFRLWGIYNARIYVTKEGKPLLFTSKDEAMRYTEEKAKQYLSTVIEEVKA
jgi:hypothetical protein